MICPKCENSEIDESGLCPRCGCKPAEEPDLPPWRLDLSRRLREIKEKREGGSAQLLREDRMRPLPFPPPEPERTGQPVPSAETPKVEPKRAPRAAGLSAPRTPRRAMRSAEQPEPAPTPPASEKSTSEPVLNISPASVSPAQAIDIVFRTPEPVQASGESSRNAIDEQTSKPGQPETGEPEPIAVANIVKVEELGPDGKLILLTRTLSGLVDLLCIFLWTVAFIVAEDAFSGIEIFDLRSVWNGILLLIANYFIYSLFFLGTANQTIGMMITNLRVVGDSGHRPQMRQVALRCLLFLPSFLLLGAGLIWAFIDHQSRCLHDTASRTKVEPLPV